MKTVVAAVLASIMTSGSASAAPATPAAPVTPPKAAACPSEQDAPDAATLVERTQQLLQGRTTQATMTMTVKTPQYTRKLKMKVWSKGEDFALVRVVEGAPRENGMMTLKREKQLWNYLPQAGRVMKLPSGMLGDAWMGSDFTNDDLVHGSNLSKDFTTSIGPGEDVDGKKTWRVVLVPKDSAAVVWGKIEMAIDRATCLPLRQRSFDEDGKLARSMVFSGFRQVGWRQFPAKMTVATGETGKETTIEYDEIAFDIDIPDDTFSLHRLEQGR